MTRRDRLIRIVEWFDDRRRRWEFDRLIAKRGLSVLTDEAMEEYARMCIASHKFSQKLNRENRARRLAAGKPRRNKPLGFDDAEQGMSP